ncbi:MAG TPA: globin domain-containing protein [Actinocrinis sp.]|nr:globin domain-containing protein [Actinocrinis sp.]
MSDRVVVTATDKTHGDSGAADPGDRLYGAESLADWSQAELIAEIRESFAVVQPRGTEAAAWFYDHFFAANPRYRKYFSGDPEAQHRRLFQAVRRIVDDLDRLDEFLPYLRRLALRHRKFGLRAAHYDAFGTSLLATLAQFCGPRWTDRAADAWVTGYGLVADVMLGAAADEDAARPPYWEGEIVEHAMLADDIARVVVRPLEDPERPGPYAFAAGQYAAVECGELVRVWRDFSFAAAPESGSGLGVEFHIQSGRAGGVSEALVRRTAVGDRIRIAAAEGELAFPGAVRADRLLAVANGTGAAPVLALLEAALAHGDMRPATLVLVSESGPHYLAERFEELAAKHGALTVEEVDGDTLAAVRAHGAATGPGGVCGAVLVGPSAMVEACREALIRAGVDPTDISSDLFD